MKTCPICHANVFDDIDICYGCMHRFSDAEDGQTPSVLEDAQEAEQASTQTTSVQCASQVEDVVELVDSSCDNEDPFWVFTLELQNPKRRERRMSVELTIPYDIDKGSVVCATQCI